MALTGYQKLLLRDIDIEVQVKGPRTVAEELEISEQAVRELAPKESREYDEATE